MNEWWLDHPRTPDHEQGFNLPDAKRFRAWVDACKELTDAGKAIGY